MDADEKVHIPLARAPTQYRCVSSSDAEPELIANRTSDDLNTRHMEGQNRVS